MPVLGDGVNGADASWRDDLTVTVDSDDEHQGESGGRAGR
jgi:hypothetical protein